MNKRIVIFEPHSDDAVIGMGGYIIDSINKGAEVCLITFTMGGPASNASKDIREAESREFVKYTGIKYYNVYDYDNDGTLEQLPNSKLTTFMDEVYDAYQPSEVFCNYKSVHRDHIALYNAFMASLRLRSNYNPPSAYLYEYQFLLTAYEQPEGGKVYHELSEDTFKKKLEAFSIFKSQLRPSPSPLGIEGVRILNETRGMEIGARYAECFYCLRSRI